jgi:hypothetical protein
MLLEGWEEDFWLKTSISISSSFISNDDEPESNKERLVYVLKHSQVIPFIELRKNIIIAVCPDEQWFLNPEEPRENFWLAKILSYHYSQRGTVAQHHYHIQWFSNSTCYNLGHPAVYELINDIQIINYGAILHHNIELNLRNSFYAKDLRIVQARL